MVHDDKTISPPQNEQGDYRLVGEIVKFGQIWPTTATTTTQTKSGVVSPVYLKNTGFDIGAARKMEHDGAEFQRFWTWVVGPRYQLLLHHITLW